jgi:hypothetical protein
MVFPLSLRLRPTSLHFGDRLKYRKAQRESQGKKIQLRSAGMMLDYLGMNKESQALENAVAAVYRKKNGLTPDQGGQATTREFSNAVLKAVR